MTEIHASNSGSDISSDSWTLLDESSSNENQNSNLSCANNENIIKINGDNEEKDVSREPNKKHSDGFLTFDEYLQERLLEHDYEQEEKPQKLRKLYKEKLRRGFKKYKAQSLGISVFIAIILGLSAFATLCSTLSQPPVEKAADVRYENPVRIENGTMYEQILEEMNETMNNLEHLKTTKLLDTLNVKKNETVTKKPEKPTVTPPPKLEKAEIPKPESKPVEAQAKKRKLDLKPAPSEMKIQNSDSKPVDLKIKKLEPKPIGPEPELPPAESKPKNSETKSEKPSPKVFSKPLTCDAPSNILKNTKPKAKVIKTKWMILKEFLLDTNLHAILSLVMTNVYLFTLLTEFAKRPRKNCRAENVLKEQFLEDLDKTSIEELRKYLFKELPFWNAEFSGKCKKMKILKKNDNRMEQMPRLSYSVAVFEKPKKIADSILFRSAPFLSEHCLTPVILPPNVETGKSECQRRFEELDQRQKKFEGLKQAQRNRIKLLKQKFRNEVSFIKDHEVEPQARAEKINRTSQLFIKKLKYNREKYLMELKKVREMRYKIAETRKNEGTSMTLPPIYDYGERFRMIKETFEKENEQAHKQFKFH